MHIKLLAFAQARDQLGFDEREMVCDPKDTPREIVQRVAPNAALQMMRVAVDQEYRGWDEAVGAAKELAIIPPVSGG